MSTTQNDTAEIDGVCDMLHNMNSKADNDNNVSICANCGKKGDDVNNVCNKCNQVKYCNAACKKKHRHKHKKQCEEHIRSIAERAAELHDIELFRTPTAEDCPICFIRLPTLKTGSRYKTCCGKTICSGCSYAPVYDNQGNIVATKSCPFCRVPTPHTNEEVEKRMKKRVEAGDPIAIYKQGVYYGEGVNGYQQDYKKAIELLFRANELGCVKSNSCIGYSYEFGRGMEVDKKKARHYYELAAMKGDSLARNNLGNIEARAGNKDRALRHYTIATRDGFDSSLKNIQQLYLDGYATKDEYTKALQAYQEYLSEIKSDQRDRAAAADDEYRYY